MAQTTRIRQIGEGDTDQFADFAPQQPEPHPADHLAANILLTSLKALSQRAIVALGNLFILLTAGSAFWLWLTIAGSPSVYQIIAVSIYGVFVLILDWMVLHRR